MKFETPLVKKQPVDEHGNSRVGKLARAAFVGAALATGSAPSTEAAELLEAARVEPGIEKMKSYTLSLDGEGRELLSIEVPAYPLFAKRVIVDGKEKPVRKIDSGRSVGTVVRLILDDGEVLSDRGVVSYFKKKAGCDSAKSRECFDVFE